MAEASGVIGCHKDSDFKEQIEKSKESGKLVVIDFTASWCPPCRFIAPFFTELAAKFPNVIFIKIDVDELKSVSQELNVEAMPTFVFLKDGKEIEGSRLVGADKDKLEATVVKHSGSAEQSI